MAVSELKLFEKVNFQMPNGALSHKETGIRDKFCLNVAAKGLDKTL